MKLLDYLQKQYGVARLGDVLWSHAVNSVEELDRALAGPAMFIEADIRLSPARVAAVAAHPPLMESDLTFEDLLQRMKTSRQGLKLDFKDPEIVEPCLKALSSANLLQPILLNAGILQGNSPYISKFNAPGFVALCRKYYPQGILSVDWTTTANPNKPYLAQNIDDMLPLVDSLDEVTFPVRAQLVPNSWHELQRLLAAKPNYTLTIWGGEPGDELRNWIRTNTDPTRTFYDLVDKDGMPVRP